MLSEMHTHQCSYSNIQTCLFTVLVLPSQNRLLVRPERVRPERAPPLRDRLGSGRAARTRSRTDPRGRGARNPPTFAQTQVRTAGRSAKHRSMHFARSGPAAPGLPAPDEDPTEGTHGSLGPRVPPGPHLPRTWARTVYNSQRDIVISGRGGSYEYNGDAYPTVYHYQCYYQFSLYHEVLSSAAEARKWTIETQVYP